MYPRINQQMKQYDKFDELVSAAQAELSDPARNRIIRGNGIEMPRFELLHTALSICSQKVRTVLAEKGLSYMSREMTTPTMAGIGGKSGVADNYRPGYVRLRIYAGGSKLMNNLAQGHTLRTSTKSEGFDACVVPTLIDHQKRQVVVDSYEICAYIAREVNEPPQLIPEDEIAAQAVMDQVRIVDGIPHPGQLYAFHPIDPRPDFLKKAMDGIYERKCNMLNQMIAENRDDEDLVNAYRAKVKRERTGGKFQRDPEYLAGIMDEFANLIGNLDKQLKEHANPWICGRDFSLADCVWGVSLFRMHWLGYAHLWDMYPCVKQYAHKCYKRPSIWEDTINWPAPVPPSPHTVDVVKVQAV